MTPEQITMTIDVLETSFQKMRAAYYNGVAGVTYDDMRTAAANLLTWRGMYERATDRKVTSKPTKAQIVRLLRN